MKVNNIQTYNSNINFKELRFKKGYVHNLSNMPEKVLDKITSVRESLADTKFYHLEIDYGDYYISHQNGERFYLPILVNKAGKALIIKMRQGLTQISKKLKYDTSKEVSQIDEQIRKPSTQFERIAEIVKVLDNYERKIKQ